MSEENVEIVRRVSEEAQAAIERGDPGAWLDSDAVAENYEWVLEAGLDGETVWLGREGFAEFMRVWTEQFEQYSARIERVVDAGDVVVVLWHQSGMGKASGVPVDLHFGQVIEVEDGRVVRTRNYLTHDEAFEAAGISQ